MTQDTKLQQLVINKLTTEQYNSAVEAGTIDPNQLYMTTDSVTISDIKVNGVSIVDGEEANITLGSMASESASDYYSKTTANSTFAAKSLETTVSSHLSATNPHNITKSTINLGNVDNTSDLNKPISTATQTALNNKVDKVSTANKIYGTDSSGVQTTYDKSNFGKVDDVTVNGTSVVSNQTAALGSMAGQNTTSYYTKSEIDGKLSAGMHFKGTKANYAALPSSGQEIGDMWNVTDTGANYAWDGTAWDKLSENVDLSGCVPTSRTINGKALSTDITLTASDVSALPSSTTIPSTVAELSDASDYVKKDGGSSQQTIILSSGTGTTPLGVKSKSSSSYISFSGNSGWLASYGVTSDKKPTVYDGTSHILAYAEDIPTTVAELTDSSNYLTTSDVVNVSTVTLATVATTGSYNDLTNKPTIPTVNNATLTIQKNGTTVNTFTANSSTNTVANITVPTTVSELSDSSNYALVSSLATVATSGDYDDLVNKPSWTYDSTTETLTLS